SETPIKLKATADAKRGLQLVALEITRDGQRHGQLFDFIVHVGEVQSETPKATAPEKKAGY
ncbi:MAG TPA: hypothetical protein VEK08_10740, partial [Planctomycetota bacterium]|nr:hypothetical protein [Planctomycetota bacterium]